MREPYNHDVAISFAGANRDIALCIAQALKLKDPEIRTYYYPEQPNSMFGKLLKEQLLKIFRKESRLVVIVVSKDYINKDNDFVQTEIEAFIPRYLMESDTYIIAVTIDDTDISEVHTELEGITVFKWKHNPNELVINIQKILCRTKDDKQSNVQHTKDGASKKIIITGNAIGRDVILGDNTETNNTNE